MWLGFRFGFSYFFFGFSVYQIKKTSHVTIWQHLTAAGRSK